MTEDQRQRILIARTGDYFGVMRTTLFVLLGIGAALHFGDGYSATLLVLAVAVTAFGILAGGTALDDIIALRDDMPDDMTGTSYGAGVKARNLPALKMVSAVLVGLTGLAAVLAVLI
ncbi:MAG: hypothetical protein HKO05_11020 [Erythrobacter sp.]|nr:hypothetical protein [Silicimonas sp.]NNC60507.1 hypothetical protein [Erythrobacter sp.]RZV98732.1 MAG: hypothetical protein EX266_16520 [Paracoccaceae bacterium]MBT8424742.1 hypothetical protein [Silicimonas sp.]NND19009.1 hypothetical protein [Silicimonas sp.]